MNSCVLLLSGGIDSVCTASILRSRGTKVYPLFCDYGQAAVQNELLAVHYFTKHLELEKPHLVSLDIWNKACSPLLNESQYFAETGFFLPFRNLQLAILGAIYANEIGVDSMAFGFHGSSGPQFTDTSPAFLDAVEKTFMFSKPPGMSIRFWRETCRLTKPELLAQALAKDIHLENTYSCYRSSRCMECEACIQVSKAFAALAGKFPTTLLNNRNPNHCANTAAHA